MKLKECPGCGNEKLEVASNCISCPCGFQFLHPEDANPAEGWNTRRRDKDPCLYSIATLSGEFFPNFAGHVVMPDTAQFYIDQGRKVKPFYDRP